jgi:hypothetical protein
LFHYNLYGSMTLQRPVEADRLGRGTVTRASYLQSIKVVLPCCYK